MKLIEKSQSVRSLKEKLIIECPFLNLLEIFPILILEISKFSFCVQMQK